MAQTIKTNIKFFQNKIEKGSKLCGLVAKIDGCWKGCRDEGDTPKKIVLPIPELAPQLQPNVLYSCTLVPMKNNNGFVAITANQVKFKATIEAICKADCTQVTISFGNKFIVYEPSSDDYKKTNIQVIADMLRRRKDLQSANSIAEDFISAASMVKRIYENRTNVDR